MYRRARVRSTPTVVGAIGVVATVVAGLWSAVGVSAGAADLEPVTAPAARTHLVEAVDDAHGARWVDGEDPWAPPAAGVTEPHVTRVAPGDTVEWGFARAGQQHDLTSRDAASAWTEPVQEYRVPGGPPVRRTFTEPGVYDYLCSIHGTTMRGTIVVEAPGNRPPALTPTVGPLTGPAPLVVHLEAGAEDPDGDELAYLWDTGDGGPALTTSHAMHSFDAPGTYEISLEVTDGRGGRARETFAVTVSGRAAVTATADRTSGPPPLTVTFTGDVAERHAEEHLRYLWDFGVPGAAAGRTRDASYTYREAGTYTATLTVSETDRTLGRDTVEVVVGGGEPLPEITATARTADGAGDDLRVRFSTEVTTSGTFRPYADGAMTHPALAGNAGMLRSADSTETVVDIGGLRGRAAHMVHVHEKPCGVDAGGAHFRFDTGQPFEETNEIWPYFTSSASGRSGRVAEVSDRRAGPEAVSVVVHDPDNPARRIGCADLDPGIADLTYAWDFGDGTGATGTDPTHTYDRPGTYTARVTVGRGHAGHGGPGRALTRSVRVTVGALPRVLLTGGPTGAVRSRSAAFSFVGAEAGTFRCRVDAAPWRACTSGHRVTGLAEGRRTFQVRSTDPATDPTAASRSWTVDTTGSVIRGVGPTGTTTSRRPTLRARADDRHSTVRRRDVSLRVDGRPVSGVRLQTRSGEMTWRSPRPLATGRHSARLVVEDALGNRSTRRWSFHVRR